jgi:hypothetical protein
MKDQVIMRSSILLALGTLCGSSVPAADAVWDASGLKVAKPEDRQDAKTVPPPKGAVVLFDGKSLDGWTAKDGKSPAKWKVLDGGVLEVSGGDILSKQMLDGDFKLHVEFRVPYLPTQTGQARGNSGVYVQGRYEVQVLDSYGIEKPAMGDAGAIYSVEPPTVNAAKAPTVWQSYDIEFHAPKFEAGKKTEPARMTVIWNGVKVHDEAKITTDNTTSGLGGDPSKPGPLMLQDHGSPVQYRNIWLTKN